MYFLPIKELNVLLEADADDILSDALKWYGADIDEFRRDSRTEAVWCEIMDMWNASVLKWKMTNCLYLLKI